MSTINYNTASTTTTASINGFDFHTDTTLVKVEGSLYPWSRKDNDAARNAANADHADADRFNVYVKLISKDAYLKPQQILSEARRFIDFPKGIKWDNNGNSAIKNVELDGVRQDLETLRQKFFAAVDELCAELPALEAKARHDLNGAFDRLGWPTEQEVRDRYKFEVKLGIAPSVNDIRCQGVSAQAKEQIIAAVREEQTTKLNDLHKQVVGALEGALSRVVNNLTEFSEGKIKRFEDTLVTNLAELVEALPRLNIAGDRAVDQTITRSRQLLTGLHAALQANTLRDKKTEAGPEVRKKIATEAKDILSKLKAGAVSAKV
jgi:hypothetical protein